MKKNLYYRDVISRKNRLRDGLLNWTLNFASFVRPLIEVFTRSNFGERYLRFSTCFRTAVFFCLLPFMIKALKTFLATSLRIGSEMRFDDNLEPMGSSTWDLIRDHYLTWYLFFAVFLYFSWKQRKYTRRNSTLFDFSKYSISSGRIHRYFYDTEFPVIGKANRRIIECYLEPLPFFVGGLLLMLLQQSIGNLLVFSSIMYSLGYMAAYRIGDNYILDKIDEIISNRNLEKTFLYDKDESETEGFSMTGNKPDDLEARRQLLPLLLGEANSIDAK